MDAKQERIETLEHENKELIAKIHHLETLIDQKREKEMTKIEALAWRTLIAHQAMPVEIYLKDTQHRFLEANQATLKVHGLNRDEMRGKTDADILKGGQEDIQRNLSEEERIYTTGEAVGREVEASDRGGQKKWLIVNKLPVKNEKGEVVGLIGVNYDVSPFVKAKDAAVSENMLLRSIIDNLPDYIYVKDAESKFVTVNQALTNVLHHLAPSPEFSIVGKTDAEFYPPEYAEVFLADDKALVDGSAKIVRKHERGFDQYGNKIQVHTTKLPIRDDMGTVQYIVGIGHDVTYLLKPYQIYQEGIQMEMAPLLDFITRQAVEITGARSSGLYRCDNHNKTVHLVGQTNRHPDLLNTRKYGQGIAGTLAETRQKKLDVANYADSPYMIEMHQQHIEKIYARLLEVDDEPIGVLYVEDAKEHEIDEQRLELFDKFVDYAAQVLLNAQRIEAEQEKRLRLQELAKTNSTIISKIPNISEYKELSAIAKEATGILQSEACTILLIHPDAPDYLIHEASYGYDLEKFPLKKTFKIESGLGTGFTGHIASQGEPFIACGDKLKHPSVASIGHDAPLGACNSILMVPLKSKQDSDEIIGWLRADNKKGLDGVSTPNICFTETDLNIAALFANFAFAVIRTFEMQLQKTQDTALLRTLIDNIPDYIYVKDRERRFKVANQEAAKRLGKEHPRDLIDKTDEELYGDAHADIVAGYRKVELEVMETGVGQINFEEKVVDLRTNKNGVLLTTKVPWVDQNTKNVLGIIGVGHDITNLKETNSLIMQDDPEKILRSAAEEIHRITQADWITIILADSQLNSRFVCCFPDQHTFERRKVRERGLSAQIVQSGNPIFIPDIRQYNQPPGVNQITLDLNFQTVVGLPMPLDNKPIGVVWLHYLPHNRLIPDMGKKLPESIKRSVEFYIRQVAVAFDRVSNRRLLTQVNKAMVEVIKATNTNDYEQTVEHIMKGIHLVSGCDIVTLYSFNPITKKYNYKPTKTGEIRFPEGITPEERRSEESLVYRMLNKEGEDILKISDTRSYDEFKGSRFVVKDIIESCLVIRMKNLQGEKLGIMFVSYSQAPVWQNKDIQLIQQFALHAAAAIQNDINYQKSVANEAQLRILRDSTKAITSNVGKDNLKALLNQIIKLAIKLLNTNPDRLNVIGAGLLDYDKKSNTLHTLASTREDADFERVLRSGEGLSGRLVLPNSPPYIIVSDYSTWSGKISNYENRNFKAMLGVCLKLEDEIVGVLNVNADKGQFNEQDAQILLDFANHVVIAMNNHEKLKALIASFNTLSRIWEVAYALRDITSLREPQVVLRSIAQTVKESFKCDLVVIYPYNNIKRTFDTPIVEGMTLESNSLMLNISRKNSSPLKILAMNKPYLEVTNTRNLPKDHLLEESTFVKVEEIVSLMAIPLRTPITLESPEQGANVGVMFVNYRTTHQFLEYEQQSLKLVADHAANVIYNARRFADLSTDLHTFSKALTFWDVLGTYMMRHLALHNEKSILAGIKWDAEELAKQMNVPEFRKIAEKIADDVVDVLNRIEEAQRRTIGEKPEKVNLYDLLDRVLDIKAKPKPVEIVKKYEMRNVNTYIEGYKHTIIPIFLVIIQNAFDELADGGILTIDATEVTLHERDAIQISFADNGSGIPEEIKEILTKQVIHSDKETGSGIGLYIAHHLMTLCNGELKFDTNENGTTFFITFLRNISVS